MSYNHENVVWQSPNGTWNRGFHPVDYYDCGESDDCDDETHEWCRQFDEDSFEWVSSGHPSRDAAYASWTGSNPGGSSGPGSADHVEHLEDMAAVLYEKSLKEEAERGRRYGGASNSWMYASAPAYRSYEGPPRVRTLKALQRECNDLISEWADYRLGGYANVTDQDRQKALNVRIRDLLASSSSAEGEAYEERQSAFRDSLRAKLDKHRETGRRNAGYGDSYYAAIRKRDEREREVEELIAKMEANASARAAKKAAPVKKTPAAKKAAPVKKTPAAKKATATKKAAPVKKTAPAKKAPVAKKTAAAARGKSTTKSTAGSFKTTVRPEADTQLEVPDVDDLWS